MSQIVKVGQIEIRYLVDGTQTGGLGLFEMNVPAGARVPPPHSHTKNEEASGAAFLRAVIVGYEVSTRIGAAMGRAHYRYWHNTGPNVP